MSESGGGKLVGAGRFPSPGSPLAQGRGCKCPGGVNDMGRGNPDLSQRSMGQRWVYDLGCPLHELDESVPCAGVVDEPRWLILVPKGEG